jgi:hypothetical protein
MSDSKPSRKAKPLREFARFATMFAYLRAMFALFKFITMSSWRGTTLTQFGVGFMNALVLAKGARCARTSDKSTKWSILRSLVTVRDTPLQAKP